MKASALRMILDRAWDDDVTVEFHDATTGRRYPVNSLIEAQVVNGMQPAKVLVLSNIPGRATVLHGQERRSDVRMRDENRAIVEAVCGPFVVRGRSSTSIPEGFIQIAEEGLGAMLDAARAEGEGRAGEEPPPLGDRFYRETLPTGESPEFRLAIETLAILAATEDGHKWDGLELEVKAGYREHARSVSEGDLEDAYPDDFPAAAADTPADAYSPNGHIFKDGRCACGATDDTEQCEIPF